MKPIKINVDAVPEEKRIHPDFIGLLNDMALGMADPAKVLSVCIHEAGHMFFGLELKMEILGLEGPQIVYAEPDCFRGYGAKVTIKIVENTVEQVAVMLSAGGIVSQELDNGLGPGDSDDLELFKSTCNQAGLTDAASIHSLWNTGQNVVRARLKDQSFREMLQELGRRLVLDLENAG